MSITDEIRELCAAHDRFMAEQASEPIRRPPVSEIDPDEIIYKESAAAATTKTGEQGWEGWEKWLRGHLDNERAVFTEALGEFGYELRKEWQQERDAELLKLRAELAELKGRVDTLLSLVTKGGEIVDLPDWRKRHA